MENNIEKEFSNYEQSKFAKELGFNEPCFRGWGKSKQIFYHPDSDIVLDNPTKSQLINWFRDNYELHLVIDETTGAQIKTTDGKLLSEYCKDGYYSGIDYYEAQSGCIDKLIEIATERDMKKLMESRYTEDEVRKLLEIQRGNCYVAVLSGVKDKKIAELATKAPEPFGKDGWFKKQQQ